MRIIRVAIDRPVTVTMFVVAVMLFGLVSLDRLTLNLLPDISYPSLTIQTDYPDAAPEEVESLVTRPIEETLGTIPGLVRMSSVSRSGQSEVVLEFTWDKDMNQAGAEVREKLDTIEQPRDVERPIILRFDPSNDPILRMHLFGDLSLSRLRYLAERGLKKGLESTEGVAAVKIVGGREEQIQVSVNEKRLAELGIPITEITTVIERANLNRSSGSLYDLDSNYLVRMLNEFRSVEEIQNLVVQDREGRRVILGDVAQVWRGAREREIIARFNGKESVEVAFYKEGDANAVSVSAAIRSRLQTLTARETFPKGVEYRIVFDQAEFIEQSVDNVLSAAVFGGLLATLVLFIFLRDARSTLIIAFAIPISVMVTFTLMHQMGITLNIMSLGGIALGVGMLVDNAIVVLESVHRHKSTGRDPAESVYRGTREVSMPVTASTLTTVAVFLPLVFVEGIAGQLFRDQALTITFSVLASLLVALTVLPMVLALSSETQTPERSEDEEIFQSPCKGKSEAAQGRRSVIALVRRTVQGLFRFLFVEFVPILVMDLRKLLGAVGSWVLFILRPGLSLFTKALQAVQNVYPSVLRLSLDHKPLVLTVFVGCLLITILVGQRLGVELIPPVAQGEFSFEIELPEGRPLEHTDRIIQEVESAVLRYPAVDTVFTSVGGSNRNQFASSALEENYGHLHVVMTDRRDRVLEEETIRRMREELSQHPEVRFSFSRPTLFSYRTPVEVEIYTFETSHQREAAELVMERLGKIDGLKDLRTTAQLGNLEIQVRLRREAAARLGLDEQQITDILHNKVRGNVASLYRDADRQIEILVRSREDDRNTVKDIRNLVVNDWASGTGFGGQVTGSASSSFDLSAEAATRPETVGSNSAGFSGEGGLTPDLSGQTGGSVRRQVPITLGAIADIAVARGPNEIHRIQSQRAALVEASLVGRDLGSVSSEIGSELEDLSDRAPAGTIMMLGGQNEELERSYRSLLFAIALAIFLVYLVMASQFESFIHPFIILFTVPLAVVGVILSLVLTETKVSVIVLLGVIVLAGIVVNNAIVLVDYTNQLRRRGLLRRAALLEAGQVRLRPILMTTITTVLGLVPMAIGWGEGYEIRAPLAITVMGGLIFSTALTLILIPVVYEIIDRKEFVAVREEA